MKNFIEKLIEKIEGCNHYVLHFAGGTLLGAASNTMYCAMLTGIATASALEYKDKAWGGTPDILDWALTVLGAGVGFGLHYLIAGLL